MMGRFAWRPLSRAVVGLGSLSLAVCTAHGAVIASAYGKLPLVFEPNRGQVDVQVAFVSRGARYTLYLTSSEVVLALHGGTDDATATHHGDASAVLRTRFVRPAAEARISGRDPLRGAANYFLGNDPRSWRTHIPLYAAVTYASIYPGIDLVFHSSQTELEYDFVVAPGADPRRIGFDFVGAQRIELDASGDLVLHLPGGEVRHRKPRVYQDVDGRRREIAGGYRFISPTQLGFDLATYDGGKSLIIDPVLSYSTFLGGSGAEAALGIAVDPEGNAYVTGSTRSLDFPAVNAAQPEIGSNRAADAFVAKLNPAGTDLIYATYLGGSDGDNSESGVGAIAVDGAGNAYITGQTASTDFPLRNAAQAENGFGGPVLGAGDAFVAKLDPTGSSLVYSTYLGGSGVELGKAIAVDSNGNAYVTGQTTSYDIGAPRPTKFPVTQGSFQPDCGSDGRCNLGSNDAFVAKYNASGGVIYATYLGGNMADIGRGIAVDADGNAYVTGATDSFTEIGAPVQTRFPTTQGAYQPERAGGFPFVTDGFVTKLHASGSSVVYSTYLGGAGSADTAHGIAIDGAGNAYVVGTTLSNDFPTTAGAFRTATDRAQDAFVTKMNPVGSFPVYSTYLGADFGYGIAVDSSGAAYVAGTTQQGLQIVNPVQPTPGGSLDAYVAVLNPQGSFLTFSSYLGGAGQDDARAVAIDPASNIYVTGFTDSTDFPTVDPLHELRVQDAFVAKISLAGPPGDANCDSVVTAADLVALIALIASGEAGECATADANEDDQIAPDDLPPTIIALFA